MAGSYDGAAFIQNQHGLLHDLHEGLLAMDLIQHADPESCEHSRQARRRTEGQLNPWHRFLDSVADLCQSQRAGLNVTAIAVQMLDSKCVWWLSMNKASALDVEPRERPPRINLDRHLSWILGQLRQVLCSTTTRQRLEQCSKDIADRSIECSSQRIHNHHRRLVSVIKEAELVHQGIEAYEDLLQRLYVFVDLAKTRATFTKICLQAYNFRRCSSSRMLDACVTDDDSDIWKRIRHLIGRLASLHNSAVYVVTHAQTFASTSLYFEVCIVPPEPALRSVDYIIPNPRSMTELLTKVCPRYEGSSVLWYAAGKMKTASARRREPSDTSQVPFVHAEAALAHFFRTSNMAFAYDDHYIGCSKPPCYCCKLYLRCRNIQVTRRPELSTAWTKWLPPGYILDGHFVADRTTVDIVRQMANTVQEDVTSHIQGRVFGVRPQFDSTTGMTFSLRQALDEAERQS